MGSTITANRLTDGVVVWHDGQRGWSTDRADAALLEGEALDSLLARVRHDDQNLAVDIRGVEMEDGVPAEYRERLRAQGPSVRSDLLHKGHGWAEGPFPPPPSRSHSSPQAGIYRYDEADREFLRQRAAQFADQVSRRLKGELNEDEFKPLRLMNGLYLQLHGYMLRVAIPYGVLSATQLRQMAYIARHYDRGYGHFTTRQNIQFNWPRLTDTPEILRLLAEADIHGIQTSGNCVRNVTTDQYAGAAADEVVDPRLYAEILRQYSTDHPEFTYLPRKFKIAITGSEQDRAAIRVHDIGLIARRNAAGEVGFELHAGGGLGRTPIIATKLRDWLPERDLLRYVEAVLRVYNALGRRDNIYKARIKILIRETGAEEFRRMVEAEFAALPADYAVLTDELLAAVGARFEEPPFRPLPEAAPAFDAALAGLPGFADWVGRNTHPHRVPGYISATVTLKPAGGIPGDATAEEMELIAGLSEQYSFGELRVSHEQNLILPHVEKEALPVLYAALRKARLADANAGLVTNIIACPGMDYCALATARAIPVAQRLSERFAAREAEIGPLDLNISGCINACGQHHIGHIGLLGVNRNGEEVYQITIGGASDEQAAIGGIIGPAVPSDDVPDAIEKIVDAYVARRTDGERFIDTYRRLGAAPFKEAVYGAH
jgi:sulfite reductase (NADPH) hemoprotein beta-component